MRSLRKYQSEAVSSVMNEWSKDVRSTLLVLPTGCGKTLTASEIIKLRRPEGKILWIAHTDELLKQAREAIEAHTGLTCGVEKAESRADLHSLFSSDDVIIASRQTLTPSRMAYRGMRRDMIGTLIVDEAHHATAAGYRKIIDHFSDAKVLGLTATPVRGDQVGLSAVFESVAYRYEIRDAIRDGYLCKIDQITINCSKIDLRDVKTLAGDLNQGQLAAIMKIEETLHQVAKPMVEEAKERPTIVFMPTMDSAREFARILTAYTSAHVAVVGGDSTPEERYRAIEGFRSGEVQFLVNCMVLTEGFDAPRASCIAIARPTKSLSLYTQMIGRGLRIYPGKEDCLVLDFVGNAGKHELVTPLDVLSGKPLAQDVKRDAKEAAANGMTVDEALDYAEKKAADREARRIAALERDAKIRADVAYAKSRVDPFGSGFDMPGDPDKEATGKLREDALRFYGKNPPKTLTVAAAHRMKADSDNRWRRGMCTQAQAREFAKRGLPTTVSKALAHKLLDAIANNGWRVNDAIRAMAYGQAGEVK
ncbi:DEAD/DEAH box helicase [bacterium]|nr:DEAD/DEAH box helicase [bacterium]